jgi:protocatechuate 3,4-dioxygenase beta subunit
VLQRTPHIHFRVVDAQHRELVTQMYFPGEPLNAQDIVYSRLSGNLTRDAATARRGPNGDPVRYEFDLVLA